MRRRSRSSRLPTGRGRISIGEIGVSTLVRVRAPDTHTAQVSAGKTPSEAVLESRGMPIYEYECRDCRRVVSVLVLRPSAAESPTCPRCHGTALTRVMSRFATIKSEEARLDSLADSASLGDIDENDPASVARFMKKMGREMGDDLGDDFDEAMDEALDEPTSDEESGDSVSSSGAADEL